MTARRAAGAGKRNRCRFKRSRLLRFIRYVKENMEMTKRFILGLVMALTLSASPFVMAHEKVKLTGYLGDVMCASGHLKGGPDELTKFAAEHSKGCGLMGDCVKSGYGVVADGKWYPFDEKGNKLAKAVFENTTKKDHIKVVVDGMTHDGKVLVESITEVK